MWKEWQTHLGRTPEQEEIITQDYYSDLGNKTPRYYQLLAINKTIVAKIDQLMALCDQLETQLDQAIEKQTAFFEPLLAGM